MSNITLEVLATKLDNLNQKIEDRSNILEGKIEDRSNILESKIDLNARILGDHMMEDKHFQGIFNGKLDSLNLWRAAIGGGLVVISIIVGIIGIKLINWIIGAS